MATASSITFVDAEGLVKLVNGMPYGGDRFGIWIPDRRPVGPAVTGLGTGRIHRFEFRRDDTIQVELAAIPESKLDQLRRLKYHLLNGGVAQLAGDRTLIEDFATVSLAPDSEPTIEASDRALREYTFTAVFKAASVLDSEASPLEEPSLIFWPKASFESAYVDDDNLSIAQDWSGHDNDATVTQGLAFQPLFEAGITPSGGPAFKFNRINNGGFSGDAVTDAASGQGEYLRSPLLCVPSVGCTAFVVAQQWEATDDHQHTCYRFASTVTANDMRLRVVDNVADRLEWSVGDHFIGAGVQYNWFIHAIRIVSGSSATQWFNGAEDPTNIDIASQGDDLNCIMMGAGGSYRIAEMQVFNADLTDSSMARRFAYLSAQHGIALV